jgi:CheY-like chemotaxis protein
LKLVRDTLQVTGYQTIEAETGEEGVRLAQERQPALILMDSSCRVLTASKPCISCGLTR